MMTEPIKKWLAALRSDTYEQAKCELRTYTQSPKYCCLGVACDVYNPNLWEDKMDEGDKDDRQESYEYMGNNQFLHDDIAMHYGITYEFAHALTILNDSLLFDFHQIADYIEGKVNNGTAFKESSHDE